MNKRLYLAALCCVLMPFLGCDKQDTPASQDDSVQVNTAALYDELGIRDEMTQLLASGDYVLTDTLLVYDAAGSLVLKLGAESHNLDPLTFSAEGLTDGSYTLVLWQTARSNSGERAWKLSGEQQLSTAILHETRAPIGFAFSAGYASATVATKSVNLEPVLTPMAIGSIIDMRIDKLEAIPDATALSLWGTNINYRTGIYLAPALDEEGRWYTDPDVALPSRAAQLPVGQTEGKFFTLYHGTSSDFQIWVDKGSDEEYVEFIRYQPLPLGKQSVFYFNIEHRSWQPPFLGSPEAFSEWKADRDAGIPVSDPLLQWGCNIEDVEEHIWSKMWFMAGQDELEYWGDYYESWHQWFRVSGYALTEQYLYETEDGENLRYVMCYCWDPDAPAELRDNLLKHQGFKNTGKTVSLEGDIYEQFLSADGETEALAIFFNEGCWAIVYRPVNQ